MVKSEKAENKAFLEKSTNHLESNGNQNIKADIDGYETPINLPQKRK